MKRLITIEFIMLTLTGILVPFEFASVGEYKLNINYKILNITAKDLTAMALNASIPGPTLRFRG